jgi:hypothetical protein
VRTEELIRSLAKEAGPVRRLPSWLIRTVSWLVLAVVSGVAVVAGIGARSDLADVLSTPAFALGSVLLVLTAFTAAAGALILAVPGAERSAVIRWLPVTAAIAALTWVAGELVTVAASGGGVGRFGASWGCVERTVWVGVVPGIVLFAMVGRAAPLRAAWAGMLALLATGAVGVLGTNVLCPVDRPLHLLLWHVLPMPVLAALGAGLGLWLLAWTRRIRRS